MRKQSKDLNIPRLLQAMRRSRWMLERPRSNRREMVRQFVGDMYSEEGTSEEIIANLLDLYVSIVGRSLIAKNPRALMSTFNRAAKPTVSVMQSFGNKEIEKMRLSETLKRIVTDSLFSIGCAKVALATPSDAAQESWKLRAGKAFVAGIDLDDMVYDAHATYWEEVEFMGHRYRVPLDTVRDSNLYSKARKELQESTHEPYNFEGDERVGMIGRGYREMQTQEYEPHVDLWEVYLPRHRDVVTLADEWLAGGPSDMGMQEGLRVQPWIGPDSGPYHVLGLGTVPGNLMPKAPIQNLFNLHMKTNGMLRKISRTMDRIKEVTLVLNAEDGERIRTADDGTMVVQQDPKSCIPMVQGGMALQIEIATATLFKDLFNEFAGNLAILGGLQPQSKTAHQDAMLNENSSRMLSDMQDRTITFVSQVIKALCWYWHHDPFLIQHSSWSVPGMPEMSLERHVTPNQRRQIPWDEIDIKVDPYSMAHATPESRMQALDAIFDKYAQLAPLFQQQGVMMDINKYLELAGRYRDMPDLQDMMTVREPPQQGATGGGAGGGMSPQTSRTYNRVSTPGRTQQGNDQNLISTMLGHDMGGANGRPKPMGQPQ